MRRLTLVHLLGIHVVAALAGFITVGPLLVAGHYVLAMLVFVALVFLAFALIQRRAARDN